MTDILVRPPELRQAAEQLRSSARKVDVALHAIDNAILSLKWQAFLGNSADAVQAHYSPKRDALLKAQTIIQYFSKDLDDAAVTFEQADKQGSDSSGDPSISPEPSDLTTLKNKYNDLTAVIQDDWKRYFAITKEIQDINNSIGRGAFDQLAGLLKEINENIPGVKFAAFLSDLRQLIEDPVNFSVSKLLEVLGKYAVKEIGPLAEFMVYLVLSPGRYSLETIYGSIKALVLLDEQESLYKEIQQHYSEQNEILKQILESASKRGGFDGGFSGGGFGGGSTGGFTGPDVKIPESDGGGGGGF